MSLPDSAEALRGAYESARDPATRGHAADWLACTLNFMEAPDEAAEIARRTTLELPELDDLGRQLEASELISLFFGARDDDGERLARLRRPPDDRPGSGPARRCSPRSQPGSGPRAPARPTRSSRWPRAALRDETLVAADAGYLVVAAILPLALADLDEATSSSGTRSVPRPSGAASSSRSWPSSCGAATRSTCAASSPRPRRSSEARDRQLWGVPAQQPWATAVLAELLVDRGAVADARAILDAAIRPRRAGSDPAILLDRAHVRVLLAEGRAEEALAHADASEATRAGGATLATCRGVR